jgi:hypothetical protein
MAILGGGAGAQRRSPLRTLVGAACRPELDPVEPIRGKQLEFIAGRRLSVPERYGRFDPVVAVVDPIPDVRIEADAILVGGYSANVRRCVIRDATLV